MKALALAAIAALPLLSGAALADPFRPTVSVIGVVQAGSGDVAIRQNSTANFAGVVQGGRNVSASVQQNGQYNVGSVSQFGGRTNATVLQTGGRLNVGAINQAGRISNTAVMGQIGTMNVGRINQIGPSNLAGLGQLGAFNAGAIRQR